MHGNSPCHMSSSSPWCSSYRHLTDGPQVTGEVHQPVLALQRTPSNAAAVLAIDG